MRRSSPKAKVTCSNRVGRAAVVAGAIEVTSATRLLEQGKRLLNFHRAIRIKHRRWEPIALEHRTYGRAQWVSARLCFAAQ